MATEDGEPPNCRWGKRIENSERGNRDLSASGRAPHGRFRIASIETRLPPRTWTPTVVGRLGAAAGDHAVASAVGSLRKRVSLPAARQIPAASSLRDRLCRARRIPRRVIMSAGTVAGGVHHPLWLREHCGECAGCPDGDRTGTCQHLLKAGGGELASRSADLPRDLRRLVTARATGRISPAPYLVI